MIRIRRLTLSALALLTMLPFTAAYAQEDVPPPPSGMPPAEAPPGAVAPQQAFSPGQLDQLAAPIALYPDPLLSQVLMASTYPLEVVEADRWLQQPGNAQLSGDQLTAALAQQPWDPSVKSLVPFPQVLDMMDKNIQWTEQLGDAFLGQQADVMNSVQRLRSMAQASGHLQSTPQQTVAGAPGAFTIEPANPQVVFVPTYNPTVVYGPWPYPAYEPYYFPPPPGYVYYTAGVIGFGFGIAIVDGLWGWDHWDWYHHRIDIDGSRFAELNRGRAPSFSGGVWEHNPAHRHGVPYAGAAARARFQGAANAARRDYRGYAPRTENNGVNGRVSTVSRPAATMPRGPAPLNQTQTRQARPAPMQQSEVRQARPAPVQQTQRVASRPSPQQQRQAAPVFESFSRGSDVRAQSARGAYSRSTIPAASRAPAQQQSRPAPSNGARVGGHDDRRQRQ